MDKEIFDVLKRIENTFIEKLDKLEEGQQALNTKLEETYQIVEALEHSAQDNKAEQDKMSNDIAYIKGDVEALRKDINNVEIITSSNWHDIAKLKAIK